MVGSCPRVFEFGRRREGWDSSMALIREFAAAGPLRSAAVEELELDEDSYRRPARCEDLSFIDFSQPVTAATASCLPFLASQRLLFAINEQRSVRLPPGRGRSGQQEFAEFYADHSRETGRRIAPFLEDFSFSFLEPPSAVPLTAADAADRLGRYLNGASEFRQATLQRLSDRNYLEEGLRFLLMQDWSLIGPKRMALRMAAAAGFFDILPARLQPRLDGDDGIDVMLAKIAGRCGVVRTAHAYWQFYLSSSLARCNLLHALAARPIGSFRLIGAAYVAMADLLCFASMAARAAERLGLSVDHRPMAADDIGAALLESFHDVIDTAEHRCGAWAVHEVAAGVAMAESLAGCARHEMAEQLLWLSSLDSYRRFAHMIDERIQRELPNIDRETFVEPREMCSTTHVHDDHRLVVIESGNMVFWGNLGMTLRLKPGEMVLVPKGRLHGSSIESDNCVYHQPIIPDAWIDALLRQAETELVH
jgi:mannose-6-phosphate isomerase-like protein (cupin superfamily)